MLLTLTALAVAGTPGNGGDECERFRPPDNITLSSESKLKADIEVGVQVFSGKTGASSDAAATYVA